MKVPKLITAKNNLIRGIFDPNNKYLSIKNNCGTITFPKSGNIKIKGLPNIVTKSMIFDYGVDKWVNDNAEKLVGSSLFTRYKELFISNIIEKFTSGKCDKKHEFIPTHVAPIFEDAGQMKVLCVEAPYCYSQDLVEFLKTKPDEISIIMRNFDVDKKKYSDFVKTYENKPYSIKSAIFSKFSKLNSDGIFCSKVQMEALQSQGHFNYYPADKINPHTLYHILEDSFIDISDSKKRDFYKNSLNIIV